MKGYYKHELIQYILSKVYINEILPMLKLSPDHYNVTLTVYNKVILSKQVRNPKILVKFLLQNKKIKYLENHFLFNYNPDDYVYASYYMEQNLSITELEKISLKFL